MLITLGSELVRGSISINAIDVDGTAAQAVLASDDGQGSVGCILAALSDDVDLERLRLSSELRRAVDAVCVHEPATNEVPLIAPATVILLSMRHEGQP